MRAYAISATYEVNDTDRFSFVNIDSRRPIVAFDAYAFRHAGRWPSHALDIASVMRRQRHFDIIYRSHIDIPKSGPMERADYYFTLVGWAR